MALSILLPSLMLWGCSQKPAILRVPANDFVAMLIPTNVFIDDGGGLVLRVGNRDGVGLQNITVYQTALDGGKETVRTTILADTGTASPSSDRSSVKIILHNARSVSGSNSILIKEFAFSLPVNINRTPPNQSTQRATR
jgi:hypothetical protein